MKHPNLIFSVCPKPPEPTPTSQQSTPPQENIDPADVKTKVNKDGDTADNTTDDQHQKTESKEDADDDGEDEEEETGSEYETDEEEDDGEDVEEIKVDDNRNIKT